jgi:predicted nucleic acid-binding protein
MAASVLIDSSAILAIIGRSDQWHGAFAATLEQLRLPLMTSEAVLTELFHLVRAFHPRLRPTCNFVRSVAVLLASIDHSELPALELLMSRYSDLPMDFADATLVHLANMERISTVFTTDNRRFQTYRMNGGLRFRVIPR